MSDIVSQTEQKIRKLAHKWLKAVRRRDRVTLDRILADDFLI
jgi:ketosteroid isomerase-like protein